ncbi:DNA polymerase III subunits gamma and tau [Pasteurella multocida subsp. multocida OH4807]|nr:DNA polymerase III subunits gamma and tau [Pasteurella multocida subsp. multocida OH4807]
MSYQVLARKWRPKTFTDVVGQSHILTALSNGLKENRLHHAYLFSGTRGVGKTSIARLFAKGLNCINGVTAEPCGQCAHCKAIEEGNFIDLIEIDAASRTKVEDTRELLDNVQYKPVQGRYKVYLIDEVHMLSRHSFNALLKTLEEPPEYVKFLLATTDPQKLPITILSRCMQFHLKALEQHQIAQHLELILKQEGIPFDFLALEKLAKAAQGSMRDSLSLTDQAIAMSNGHITLPIVQDMLGLLDDNQALEMIHALQQGNGEALMQVVQAVAEKGGDWDELLRDMAEKLHHIAMQQLLPSQHTDDASQLAFLASHLSPEDIQFFYQVILTGRKELAFAPNRRIGVEMTLLRALAFHPKHINTQAISLLDKSSAISESTDKAEQNQSAPNKYVDMPVISQTIKAQYKSDVKAAPTFSPQSVSSSSIDDEQETSVGYSAALDAFAQLDKLNTLSVNPQKEEKKNSDPKRAQLTAITSEVSHKTEQNMTALPIVEMRKEVASRKVISNNKPSSSFLQKTAELNMQQSPLVSEPDEARQEGESDELDETHLAETYRWEWRNPELAKTQDGIKPSELKHSLEQEITPELRQKVIQIAREQDPWTDLVEALPISNLTKELALNCVLVEQEDTKITLAMKEDKVHLNTSTACQVLQQALSQFLQKTVQLSIEPMTTSLCTPMERYCQTYKTLREQAKLGLEQDEKLQLFLKEFNAELDLSTVKPV